MSITLIGGMDRLAKHYQGEAKKHGINLDGSKSSLCFEYNINCELKEK